jgi:penicillin V acylase-like amidase (Ntn superfamily)
MQVYPRSLRSPENGLKQCRTFGADKPLPGERTPSDRFVRGAYYASGLPRPVSRGEAAAYMFSVIRTVQDLTGGRYYFESTYAPNVVWIDYDKLDFSPGGPETELQVERKIFSLNGDVSGQLQPEKPFVFGVNKR